MLRSAEVDETSKQIIKIEKIEEGRRNGIIVMSQELEVLMSLQTTSITQLCRVCLTKNSYLESLFSMPNNSPHEKTLADILPCIANVKPSYGDGLPENVCKQCVSQIDNFFTFKQLCEKSEAVLQRFFSNRNKLDSVGDIEFIKTVNHSEKQESEIDASTGIYFDVDFQNSPSSDNSNNKNNLKWKNNISQNIQNSTHNQLNIPKHENSTSVKLKSKEKPIKKRKLKAGKSIKKETKSDTNYESNSYCSNDYNEDIETKESITKPTEKKKISIDPFICRWCGKQFPSQHRLNRHERIHQIEKLYNCVTCKKGFNELRNYRRHISRHKKTEENIEETTCFPCSDCHMKFSSEMDLQIHSSIHAVSGNKRVCQHCKKEFDTTVQLKRHVRIHMIDKPHKCSVCQKGFPEMGSLTRHFRRHTGEIRERKHICKFCDKAYYDRHSLNIHERKHTGVKPWKCLECGKRFIDSRLLNSHLKTHSDIKPYACDMCDKSFRHESTLTTHKRIHTGEKPYVCSVCGNAFVQSSNLSLHMRTHTRERPYSCEFCVKRFSSSSALTTHVRTHTGEKPYVCTICYKRFARYDMRAHMRTHTGEKPYVCTVCDRRFITPGQLQQHIRIHTGERPFTCTVCGKGCTTSCYLKRHMARTHNMMTVTPNIPSVIESKIESVGSTEECVLTEIEEKSENIVISAGQVLNITPNTVTLTANNLNVVTVDNSNAQLDGLGISTCMSTNEHEMVSTEVNVGTIVADALITDDKLYQIDPSLIRIHHVSTANLIHSGQITLSTITDTSH